MGRKITIVAVVALMSAVLAQVPRAAFAPAGIHTFDQPTFVFSQAGSPKPGELDPTFSGDGIVIADLGAEEQAFATAIQRDGKIVVGGITSGDFLVVRYRVDGVLDRSFGSGGYVRTDFSGYGDRLESITIQPDRKIVAAGSSYDSETTTSYFALARYNADGSLDSRFGSGGKVRTAMGPAARYAGSFARAVVLQPDGKIVAAGGASHVQYASDFALVRYKPDGGLDKRFGAGGKVLTSFSSSSDFAVGVAVDARGRIVAGGSANWGAAHEYSAVARYKPDGRLDPSFGAGGKATTPEGNAGGNPGYRQGLALQSNGKVILGGRSLIRYNANGSLDTGFGSGGQVALDGARALAIQGDGRIIAVGHPNISVRRYKPNGAVDVSFGRGGRTTTALDPAVIANSVSLQSDGRIVVAGGTMSVGRFPQYLDVAVVRYFSPAPCRVPNVRGKKLAVARSVIAKAHCRVGKVTRKTSKSVERNRVISQSPKAGTYLPTPGKVNLVISRGRR